MRFLVDENCPHSVVQALADRGHDLFVAPGSAAGASDSELLQLALAQERIIVTADSDFGQLVIAQGAPIRGGVLLALGRIAARRQGPRLAQVLDEFGEQLIGHFTTVEPARVRRRALGED